MVIVFSIFLYVQGHRQEMTLTHKKVKGYRVPYPIKLIYTSSIPIMFLVAFFANFYLFS